MKTAEAAGTAVSWLHPRAAASLVVNVLPGTADGLRANVAGGDVVAGVVGELHPDIVARFDLKGRAVVFDLDVDVLARAAKTTVTTRPLPRFPAVRRDFALVVDEKLPAAELRARFANNEAARGLLESVSIFDVYQGKGVAVGKKSVAVAVTLRADDRTLTDVDVQKLSEALIADVKQLGAEVR